MWVSLMAALWVSMPAAAKLMPDNTWYVFGDTVSLGYPRVTYTNVVRQITKSDYDDQTYGKEGIYSTETEGTETYYFYSMAYRDTTYLVFSAQQDENGEDQIIGYGGRATSLNDLWYIVDCTPYLPTVSAEDNMYWPRERVRMRAKNLKTGKWIAYKTDARGEVVLDLVADSTKSSLFGYYMDEEEPNYHFYDTDRATSFLPVFYQDDGAYYMQSQAKDEEISIEGTKAAGNYVKTSRTRNYIFKLEASASYFMQCFQWTQANRTSFSIEASPISILFGYAKDKAAATAQKTTQNYHVTLTDSTNLYCVYARAHGLKSQDIMLTAPKKVDDATTLINDYGIEAKFYWASNGTGSYTNLLSALKSEQINNNLSNVAAYQNEKPRNMLTRSEATHNGVWKIELTPDSVSPYNVVETALQSAGAPVNYNDALVCDIVNKKDNTVLQSLATSVARTAYRQTASTDSIYVTVNPVSPMLPATGGTAEFTYSFEEVKTEIRYTAAGVIDSVYTNTHNAVAMKDLDQVQFALRTEDNQDFTDIWITDLKVDTANSKVTFKYVTNNSVDIRSVKLVCTATRGNYHSTSFNYIQQYTLANVGKINFVHTKGGYGDLMPKNARGIRYQQVHTVEKTIYYKAGEEIAFVANEPIMQGYWRWYDYDSDLDPQYYWDGETVKQTSNFWKNVPKNNYYDGSSNKCLFLTINANIPSASRGYYWATSTYQRWILDKGWKKETYQYFPASEITKDFEQMIPKINAWSDKQKRNIALDASAYQDIVVNDTMIQEPTLSYRQIWHLLPAEDMADSLMKCTSADNPYETHEYIALTGQDVYLATNLTHRNYAYHQSELSYWYYGTNSSLKQVGSNANAKWKKRESTNGGASYGGWSDLTDNYQNDYQKVNSSTAKVIQYALYVPGSNTIDGKDLYIATFTVTFVPQTSYGPSKTELMSRTEVAENYNLLAEQNFNFGTKAGSLDTTGMVFYPYPLAADNSSFGFVFDAAGNTQHKRVGPIDNAKNFPFYGEYCLVNQVTGYDWAIGKQHGGAANGYMLYVDGKMQPGLVTTISTDAQLCSGQQMYCYLWVSNPAKKSTNGTGNTLPIFRFDIQGRNSDSEAWTSVGAFFAGQIPVQSDWMQVNFPVVSKANYTQTRIAVYNFANDVSGNDFFIDDVCLYATKLPLQAYQAFTSCDVENMTVAVVRVDYDNMTSTGDDQTLYYTIENTKADTLVKTVYHYPSNWADSQKSDEYGVIFIPQKGYNPTKNLTTSLGDESDKVFSSASLMIDSLETLYIQDQKAGTVKKGYELKGYVKTTDNTGERYILYVAHLVSNACTPATGKYALNMAATYDELKNPECAMTAALSLQNKTQLKFGDGETDARLGACANGLYPVTVNVNNTLDIDGKSVTLGALAKADWLLGYEFDDIYDPDSTGYLTEAKKQKADMAFKAKYGYERGKVQDALQELRRYPSISNYTASSLSDIIQDTIGTDDEKHSVLLPEHYAIIADLYNRNLLKLYRDSDRFYMRQQDTLRYWIYPIAGTAQVEYNGKQYTLDNCSNRTFLRAYTGASDHTVNVSPIEISQMTDEQKHAIPRVRVAAKAANTAFRVPVTEITDRVVFGWDSCRVVSSTDPVVQQLIADKAGVSQFSMRYTQNRIYQDNKSNYYKAKDTIIFRPVDAAHVTAMQERHATETGWTDGHPGFWHANTHTMRPGYEYTMMVTLLNQSLATKDVDASCAVGTVYFTVVVVPDTVVWAPVESDYWGDDENWHAIINGKQVENGMVPLAETDVVIPTLSDVRRYPYLCDSIFYPMDANYVTAKCHKILFQSQATMLNQQKLAYDSAYVDMTVNKDTWHSIAMPLKDVYSGDLYVPHSGKNYTDASAKNLESTDYFTISSFKGIRDSLAAYAAWSTYYNDSVKTVHYSPSGIYNTYNRLQGDGDLVFYSSNTVDKKIDAFGGLQMGIWGPDNLTDDQITIRLPKPDTKYDLYLDGVVKSSVTIDRTNAHKFAFEPDENGQMKVTLHNNTASNWFIWGNPTMAYVDAEAFYLANSDKIEANYKVMVDGEWKTRNKYNVTYQSRFVAPFESVLVYAKEGAKKDLELVLTVNCLASSNINGGRTNYQPGTVTRAPQRIAHSAQGHYFSNGLMHIAAGVRYAGDMKNAATASFDLVATDFANNGFDQSEDALFVSTGVADDGTIRNGASEMNLYSLVGDKGLSIDVREQIGIVPLGFLVSNDMREVNDGKMTLYFTLTDWEQECYLVDALTGTKTRIINCTELLLDIPQNHEMRYYIQGPYKDSSDDTPTDNHDVVTPDAESTVSVFSPAAGLVNVVASADIASVRLYDVTGLLVAEKAVSGTPVLTMAAPSGVLVAEVRLADGTIARQKVFVR